MSVPNPGDVAFFNIIVLNSSKVSVLKEDYSRLKEIKETCHSNARHAAQLDSGSKTVSGTKLKKCEYKLYMK